MSASAGQKRKQKKGSSPPAEQALKDLIKASEQEAQEELRAQTEEEEEDLDEDDKLAFGSLPKGPAYRAIQEEEDEELRSLKQKAALQKRVDNQNHFNAGYQSGKQDGVEAGALAGVAVTVMVGLMVFGGMQLYSSFYSSANRQGGRGN